MPAISRFIPVCLFCFAVPGSSAIAQDDFVPLIQNDSLDGWRGDLDSWTVENGVLIGKADGTLKANRFIVADVPPVANFELQVDVRVTVGGNSGLQYRSQDRPDLGPFVVTGYQCDVVSNRDVYNGMLYEERGRRILAHAGQQVVIDPAGQPWITGTFEVKHFAPGEWHHFRVLVEGNHHRHWIDGVQTVDVIDLDEQNRSLSGVVGVQVHVGPPMEICYRNMKLKRLSDDLPIIKSQDAKIPDGAEKVEPQGGWKMAGVRDQNSPLEDVSIGDIPNLHQCGDVLLSGQPSAEDLRLLAQKGIRTVITLRPDSELDWNERDVVEAAGMEFISIPVAGPDSLTDEVFEKIRDTLRKTGPQNKTLLHCKSANRVGAVWAIHRIYNGRMAPDYAVREAKEVGLRSPPLEEKLVDYLVRHRKL